MEPEATLSAQKMHDSPRQKCPGSCLKLRLKMSSCQSTYTGARAGGYLHSFPLLFLSYMSIKTGVRFYPALETVGTSEQSRQGHEDEKRARGTTSSEKQRRRKSSAIFNQQVQFRQSSTSSSVVSPSESESPRGNNESTHQASVPKVKSNIQPH